MDNKVRSYSGLHADDEDIIHMAGQHCQCPELEHGGHECCVMRGEGREWMPSPRVDADKRAEA